MKGIFGIIFLYAILSRSNAQLNLNWMEGLFDHINKLNQNINENVGRITQDIQDNVQSQLARLDELQKQLNRTDFTALSRNGNSIIINGSGGTSRTVYSGHTPDGQPYFRDTEERVVGDTLYHYERFYNPKTKNVEESRYTLNLSDPNAKPVPINNE